MGFRDTVRNMRDHISGRASHIRPVVVTRASYRVMPRPVYVPAPVPVAVPVVARSFYGQAYAADWNPPPPPAPVHAVPIIPVVQGSFYPAQVATPQISSATHQETVSSRQELIHREKREHRNDAWGNHIDTDTHEDRLVSEQQRSHVDSNSYYGAGSPRLGYLPSGYEVPYTAGSVYHADQYAGREELSRRTDGVHRSDPYGGRMDSYSQEERRRTEQYQSHDATNSGYVGSMYSPAYPAVDYDGDMDAASWRPRI